MIMQEVQDAGHAETGSPIVDITGLDVFYGRLQALKDISLKIYPGEMVGILGPNGSGKTTLLHSIMGLIPSASGSIRLWGRDLSSYSSKEKARVASLLPQTTETPFPFPVLDVVLMGRYPFLKLWQGYSNKDIEVAQQAMEKTGVAHLSGRPFRQLSGGERQSVLLARSFAQGSRLLLLDEATSSLDIRRKIEVFDLLLQENNRNNRTVLSVLHDINLASMYLNRLIFLKEGRLVAEGKTEEVLTPEILGDVYETRVLVENHPVTGRPFILFLTGNS